MSTLITATYDYADLPHKETPLPHPRASTYGYGSKLPTHRMVQLPGSPRWRRVYCCIYSNVGTCYVTAPGNPKHWIVIL